MVKNVLIKVPLKSSNKVKTLDLKKKTFSQTDCKNHFQRSYAISITIGFDFRVRVKISTTQEKKQKWFMCNQASTRKQEHESKTIVLRIMTPTNSNAMTLRVFWWRR